MDIQRFLTEITAQPGVPGYEVGVQDTVIKAFAPLVDDVHVNALGNVVAQTGTKGPHILLAAHQDEIGLMVTKIEEDGCLRVTANGGVDPRILPGMEVYVHTRTVPLYGVIGAKPPHLLSAADREQAVKMKSLYIDIGYDVERVRELVQIGNPVTMIGPTVELADGQITSKTLDDRAGIAAMVVCAETLKRMNVEARVSYVSSTQEEIGSFGAQTSTAALQPDVAIAIDVTHAEGPGTGKWEALPIDQVSLATGPSIHPMLLQKIRSVADRYHIPYGVEVDSRYTGTDADAMWTAGSGVPCLVVSIPLKYMHTTVETIQRSVIEEVGRLLALFIDELACGWEDLKWY